MRGVRETCILISPLFLGVGLTGRTPSFGLGRWRFESSAPSVENQTVTMKCTDHCGFSVTGGETFCKVAYDDHDHQADTEPWYSHLFSGWTVLAILIVVVGIVSIVNGTPFLEINDRPR